MFESDVMTIFSSFMLSSVFKQKSKYPQRLSFASDKSLRHESASMLRKLVLETCNHVGQRDLTEKS